MTKQHMEIWDAHEKDRQLLQVYLSPFGEPWAPEVGRAAGRAGETNHVSADVFSW